MTTIPSAFFIFDVESIGLHGEGFAVAGGIFHSQIGVFDETFCFSCHPERAAGTDTDRAWILTNVPRLPEQFIAPEYVRQAFWNQWIAAKTLFPGIVMAAECLWPVEAKFVIACVADDPEARNWEGPYPFHEIASFMAAAGMNPMESYERQEDELPAHDPRGDARLSARLLGQALKLLKP